MSITAIDFDVDKQIVPVSASMIRKDLFQYWKFLPDAVKQDLALKVVISGTESTGKTMLTQKLSAHYKCSQVLETGRDIISDSYSFTLENLYKVAEQHALNIQKACCAESPLIIIDTDIFVTESYGLFSFSHRIRVDPVIYECNKANLLLYLCNDVEHVQDGSRFKKEDRDALDFSHRRVLSLHKVPYTEISGDWNFRFQQAVQYIDSLLQKERYEI